MKTIHVHPNLIATVSDEDFDRVSQRRWRVVSNGLRKQYVRGTGNVYLHRLILSAPKGTEVDHINGDTFDNRRENLRFCTRSENLWNSGMKPGNASGFKGVSLTSHCKDRWSATIRAAGQHIYLGSFATREEAARAYDAAAKELHGDFARTNFS